MSVGPTDESPSVGADPSEKSLGQLMGEVVSDMGTLVRQEIELAKVETKEELGKAGKVAGAFGGAAVAAYMALLFLSLALAWLLSQTINRALSFAIVGLLYAFIGGAPRPSGSPASSIHQSIARTDHRNSQGGRAVGQSTEELRREIAETRDDLGTTVDAISDRVSPSRVVERRKEKLAGRWNAAKESIMGSATDIGGSVKAVGDTRQQIPRRPVAKTQGAPMVAGAIAFGLGFLAAAMFPGTDAEAQLAQKVQEVAQPAVDELKQSGSEAMSALREPVLDSAQHVKDAAASGVQEVRGTAREAVEQTKDTAAGAKEEVSDQAQHSADNIGDR